VLYALDRSYSDSILYFEKAQQIHPDDAMMNIYLGESYEKVGEGSKALQCYETALCHIPSEFSGHIRSRIQNMYRDSIHLTVPHSAG
jgi:tetratricopeptide (TPR) repeat protein